MITPPFNILARPALTVKEPFTFSGDAVPELLDVTVLVDMVECERIVVGIVEMLHGKSAPI
jgi:hypothetical protein